MGQNQSALVAPSAASPVAARPTSPVATRVAPTTNTNTTTTPARPAFSTNSPDLETPAVADNPWLTIYSPCRTPVADRFKTSEFALEDKVLGEGSFACVRLATHLPTQKKVAVKVIDKSKIPDSMRMYAAREPGILRDLKHPNVVKMLHTEETRREIQIYLQFMEGCDMHSYVQQHQRLVEREARRLFAQILDAVEYVHSKNVCHRDLKLENILISKTKRSGTHRAMVIDFGFAGHIPTPSFKFTDHPGSVCYAAPELLAGKPYDGKMVDVYALGVTLYVMLHGCYPFYNQNTTELYRMIWHEPVAIDTSICSPEVCEILTAMLNKNPAARPTLTAVKAHPWFASTVNPYLASASVSAQVASPIKRLKTSISKRLSPQVRRRTSFAM